APHVSPELAAVVERALAVDPRERYATARELGEDLDRCLRRLPPRHVRVRPARMVMLYGDYVVRHPASWIVAAALIAAFFALRPVPLPLRADAFSYERTGQS